MHTIVRRAAFSDTNFLREVAVAFEERAVQSFSWQGVRAPAGSGEGRK